MRRAHAAPREAPEREVLVQGAQVLRREVPVYVDIQVDAAARRQIVLRLVRRLVQIELHRPHVGERDVRVHVDDWTDGVALLHDQSTLVDREPGQTREIEQARIDVRTGKDVVQGVVELTRSRTSRAVVRTVRPSSCRASRDASSRASCRGDVRWETARRRRCAVRDRATGATQSTDRAALRPGRRRRTPLSASERPITPVTCS